MLPVFLQLGPLTFHTYGLLIALGVLLCLQVTISLAQRDGTPKALASDALHGLLAYGTMGGIAGGRLVYVINFPETFAGNWISVFKIWEGGLVSYGGLAGLLIGFAVWHSRNRLFPWRRVLDWMAPGMAFGHALGRLGCFAAGCCYGRPTNLPWSVTFTRPDSLAPLFVPLHPSQLYESALLTALGFFLLKRFRSARPNGAVFLEYLLLYSAGRFALEFLRGDPRVLGPLTWGQLMSLVAFAAALMIRCGLFSSLFSPKTD